MNVTRDDEIDSFWRCFHPCLLKPRGRRTERGVACCKTPKRMMRDEPGVASLNGRELASVVTDLRAGHIVAGRGRIEHDQLKLAELDEIGRLECLALAALPGMRIQIVEPSAPAALAVLVVTPRKCPGSRSEKLGCGLEEIGIPIFQM